MDIQKASICHSSSNRQWLTNCLNEDAEKFQICQRDGTCTAGCVLQEKEGLLELVEKGKKKVSVSTILEYMQRVFDADLMEVEMRIVIEESQLELRRTDKLRVSRAAAAEMKTQLLEHTNSVTGKCFCLVFMTCRILVQKKKTVWFFHLFIVVKWLLQLAMLFWFFNYANVKYSL